MEHYKNLSLEDVVYFCEFDLIWKTEQWKNVTGYNGAYMVSDLARIKAMPRYVKHPINGFSFKKEKIRRLSIVDGYPHIIFCKNGILKSRSIHTVVAEEFLNHRFSKDVDLVVDHINNNSMDSRLVNLQLITYRDNLSKDRKGKSGLKGVFSNGNNFIARIRIEGRLTNLGTYKSKTEAHNKYLEVLSNLKK